jgi:exosortase K
MIKEYQDKWLSLRASVRMSIVFTVLLVFSLKLFYNYADTDDMLWIIKPTAIFTSVFTAQSFQYISGEGYYFADSDIIINKSCSGIVFLMVVVCCTAFSWASYTHIKGGFSIWVVLLGTSYLLTVFVNSSRIMLDMFLKKNLLLPVNDFIHEALGVAVYLIFLFSYYLLLYRYFNRLNK